MQYHLLRALEGLMGPAARIAPLQAPEEFTGKWMSRIQKRLGIPRRYACYSDLRLMAYARAVEGQLPTSNSRPVVFFGALPFVKCRPRQPYYIYTDGAFFIHYWEYNQDHTHAPSEIRRICAAEAEFMRRSAGVWCSSQWAADRITKEYALDPGQARFVGTGPGDVPPPVQPLLSENFLVMIAGDFERKGGRLAVAAVTAARRLGSDVGIKFIGARPPDDLLSLPFVEWCGWLDLRHEGDRRRFADVMSRAGAHILLSRVDLTPLAIPEAAAYSKATLATRVGGVPEMIEHGKSGWLAGKGDGPEEIGSLVARIVAQPEKLRSSGFAANSVYRKLWNWPAVAEKAVQMMHKRK